MSQTSSLSVFVALLGFAGCSGGGSERPPIAPPRSQPESGAHRAPGDLARAPLRNENIVVLNAPIDVVWEVIADHSQLPSYAAGIREVQLGEACDGPGGGVGCPRTCVFHEGPPALETVVLVDEPHAIGTSGVEPSPYQVSDDLTWITLRSVGAERTEVRWQLYFQHPEPEVMQPLFEQGFQEMGKGLIHRFGGEASPS